MPLTTVLFVLVWLHCLTVQHTTLIAIAIMPSLYLQGLFSSVLSVFRERELMFTFAICCRPLSVCLSSVCNTRAPYSGSCNFWQFFYCIWFDGRRCIDDWLWSPYVIGQTIIFLPCDFYLFSSSFFLFFSLPNLSGHRLDVYHTSTHSVALVRI